MSLAGGDPQTTGSRDMSQPSRRYHSQEMEAPGDGLTLGLACLGQPAGDAGRIAASRAGAMPTPPAECDDLQ